MIVFQIYDTKAQDWQVPFYMVSREVAIRTLRHEVLSNPRNVMAKFPSDYLLYEIGTWEKGVHHLHEPDQLGSLDQYMETRDAQGALRMLQESLPEFDPSNGGAK